MASLLRSGKFVRLFSNLTRNFDLNNGSRNNPESLLCSRRDEWEIKLHRSLSAVHLPLKNLNESPSTLPPGALEIKNVDEAIARADAEIKERGRISSSHIQTIMKEIEQTKTASASQGLLLIRCCGKLVAEETPKARTKLVKEVWELLERLAVPLDISHHNALLRVYQENDHDFKLKKFLDNLEKKNVEPNRVTYQRLVAIYCQRGDISGASQMLEIMKSKGLPINEMIFNSLVLGHANIGDMESAKGVIQVMSQSGLQPNGETYCALMTGYAKKGLLQELTATMSECENENLLIHDRDLLEVLVSAAVNKQPAVVDFLLSRMQKTMGYKQECTNVILRLINLKCEEEAFKILSTLKPRVMENGNPAVTGNFFVNQLVKSNSSPDIIVSFCQRLVDSGKNSRAFFLALGASNSMGNTELTNRLLNEIKNQKEMMQPFKFWPYLISQLKVRGEKGMLDALKQMTSLNMYPNVQSLSTHVLPNMEKGSSTKDILKKLRSANVPSHITSTSVLLDKLYQRDFASAIEVAQENQIPIDMPNVARVIAEAYLTTLNAESVAKLIHSMLREPEPSTEKRSLANLAAELTSPILREIVNIAPQPKVTPLEPLMKALRDQGLGVSQGVIKVIQDNVGDDMTDSFAELLTELGSGNLSPVNLLPAFSQKLPLGGKMAKFIDSLKNRNLEEALKLKQELENTNTTLSPSVKILMMDMYNYHDRLDDAMSVFEELFGEMPDLKVYPPKIINFAVKLLKAERIDDTWKVLQKLAPSSTDSQTGPETSIWRLLNIPADSGNAVLTQELFDHIEKSNVMKIDVFVLGPLVKVHLVRDDIEAAMRVFLECAKKYRFTPLKSRLMIKLIETENVQALQELMDASINIHGEMNSLFDLVFAFLESGRVRQAKKVLETPGLRARPQRLETVCKRYVEEKRIVELENLIKITRGVFGIDRQVMYNYMLDACIVTEDVQRAQDLWTMAQEEELQPSEDFLRKLGKFLTDKNQSVPFTVPEERVSTNKPVDVLSAAPSLGDAKPNQTSSVSLSRNTTSSPGLSATRNSFRLALNNGDVNTALNIKRESEKEGKFLNFNDESLLIKKMIDCNRIGEIKPIVLDMLGRNTYPIPSVFKQYFWNLASSGDEETLLAFEPLLSPEKKRIVQYQTRIADVQLKDPVRAASHLDNLYQQIKKLNESDNPDKTSEAKELIKEFANGNFTTVLKKNPELLGKCQEIAKEYLKVESYAPTNALWCFYFINGHRDLAQSAWDTLVASKTTVGFSQITQHIRKSENLALAQTLVETLSSTSHIKTSAVGLAFSAWIDVLCKKNMLDEANATLNKAITQGVQLSEIGHFTLNRMKTAFTEQNREFPFSIPEKVIRNRDVTEQSEKHAEQ